jgi:DNA-binding MarR family transcriptional regulator
MRWLSADEQCAWRAYLEASQRLFEQLDRELEREVGMPLAYYQILAMLSEAPARTLRMSDLAAQTWSSRSRLSHAVDRLEQKGWVERLSCPSDKRGAYALLTAAGLRVLEAAAPSHVSSVRRLVFDRLAPADLEALARVSRQIVERIAAEAAADPTR